MSTVYVSAKQAADHLGVSLRWIRYRIAGGYLRPYRARGGGRMRRYRLEDVERLMVLVRRADNAVGRP